MLTPRYTLVLAFGALCWPLSGASAAAPPKPRTVVPGSGPTTQVLPPAEIDDTLAIGGADISARKVNTRMTVEVRINGRGPYRFLVDSGADTSVVGTRIARDLSLPAGAPATLNSMTTSTRVERVVVDELSLGPSTIRNLEVPALLERNLGADGIVGIDALVGQRLMMDFDSRVIKVEDARRPARMLDGEIVVTARRKRGQLILTQVSAGGRRVQAVIDTGSDISIGNLILRDMLIRKKRTKFITVKALGVTGETIDLELAIISELRLGKITLSNVPVAFADVLPFRMFGLAAEPALLLGTDLLGTFRRVSLDFRRRKVRFQLKRCRSTDLVITTAPDTMSRLSSSGGADVCGR